VAKDSYIADLLKDLEGQTTEAISRKDYYTKWGRHFLPSLMGAHLHQYCNNFKDPGVQHYSPKVFTQIRDKFEESFLKLPPPKSSMVQFDNSGVAVPPAPVDMNNFYDAYGGCFDGECTIQTPQGLKLVKNIRHGDVINTSSQRTARVICVVKTPNPTREAQLVELSGGLLITAWHPIRFCSSPHNANSISSWVFPHSIALPSLRASEAIYTFVLDSGHVAIVNGVECVTLGHEMEDNEVVKHPYFGTQRVVEDLKGCAGWVEGLVQVKGFLRDPVTGLVNGVLELPGKVERNFSVSNNHNQVLELSV
jgi:hypothetical protein